MNDFYNAAETTVVKVLFGQSATIFNNQVSLIWRKKYVRSCERSCKDKSQALEISDPHMLV